MEVTDRDLETEYIACDDLGLPMPAGIDVENVPVFVSLETGTAYRRFVKRGVVSLLPVEPDQQERINRVRRYVEECEGKPERVAALAEDDE